MAFNSFFNQLPFGGHFDNGMPVFPFGGAYGGIPQNNQPGPVQGGPYAGLQPTQAPIAPTPSPNQPAAPTGSDTLTGVYNLGGGTPGGGAGIDGTSPTIGGGIGGSGYGDAQFATMGFNPPTSGGSSGQGTSSNFGAPDIWGSISGTVSNKADTIGNNFNSFIDRINSVGNSPHFNNDNLAQTGINAAGFVSPFVPILAGIAQGFNLFDPTSNTGNAATNLIANPGIIQSGAADAANWVNRQFGGEYMPYDAGSHAAQEPGAQAALQGLSNPYPLMSPAIDSFSNGSVASPSLNSDSPIPGTGESYGGGDFIGTAPMTPYDPYSMSGNMWTDFLQGATFGGGRFDGFGGAGGGNIWGIVQQPDNNGGWGQ